MRVLVADDDLELLDLVALVALVAMTLEQLEVAALGDHVALLYEPFSISELRAAMRSCVAD